MYFRQQSLVKEREMREKAEHELANMSMNGHRDHFSPSPTLLRSRLQSPSHRSKSPAPGNIDGLIQELKAARMLNRTVSKPWSEITCEGVSGFEITAGHHCGGETFQSIFNLYSAKNTLKSLSSTVITVCYFKP